MARENGHPPPQQAVAAPPRITILNVFGFEVDNLADGGKALKVLTPQGEQIILPFDAAGAKKLGQAFTAPSVEVPGGPMPPPSPLL
jgi:hypothetical protein